MWFNTSWLFTLNALYLYTALLVNSHIDRNHRKNKNYPGEHMKKKEN